MNIFKILHKRFLLVFFMLCSVIAYTQKDSLKIDSLKKVLATEKEDTNKVNTLNELSFNYYTQNDFNNSMQYAKKALFFANKIDFKRGIADAYKYIGVAYQENYSEALKSLYAALKVYEELNDKVNISTCHQYIGAFNTDLDNYSEGLKNYFFSLKLRKEIGDQWAISQTCLSIGGVYNKTGNYSEAKKYHNEGLEIFKELGAANKAPSWGLPFGYASLSNDYQREGEVALTGNIQAANKAFNKALDYGFLALKLWKKIGWDHAIGATLISIGELYTDLKKTDSAKYYLEEGLKVSEKQNSKSNLRDSYNSLSRLDSMQGNYKQAYKSYKMFILYRDSLNNEETTKKGLQASMQYDFDKKEAIAKGAQDKKDADAKRIKNQQFFTILALGIVVLAVVVIALIQFRNNKQKQKANLLLERQKQKVEITLTELKSTQAQLIQSEKMASLGELTAGIAHEIQNPLNFVNNFSEVNKELIEELRIKNEKLKIEDDEVNDLLSDLADNSEKINHHGKRADAIVKGMLQHSRQSSGTKEPTNINALCDEYLRLSYHGLRAKDKSFNADYKTDFDESIGKINIMPQDIGRVLLNLFNNAFYAVNEKFTANRSPLTDDYKPLVFVQTKKIHDKAEIRVTDNGNGIPQNIIDKIFQPFFTTKPTGQGTGLGLSLAYDIITKEHNGTIKVESKEGEGSEFIIELLIA